MKARLARFFDECKLAALGILLATRKKSFWAAFLITFVVFGTLISLLSAGTSAVELFFATNFAGKMRILINGFFTLFGKGRSFGDFLLNFTITLLQSTLIGLLIFVYRTRKKNASRHTKNRSTTDQKRQNLATHASTSPTDSAESAGIAAGLALLGSGCPTCGTTLITPILTSIFSTGSYAIAGTISGILTTAAILLLLYSLKKMGLESYVIIKSEIWHKKRADDSSRTTEVVSHKKPTTPKTHAKKTEDYEKDN